MKFNYVSVVTLMSAAGGAALALPGSTTLSPDVPASPRNTSATYVNPLGVQVLAASARVGGTTKTKATSTTTKPVTTKSVTTKSTTTKSKTTKSATTQSMTTESETTKSKTTKSKSTSTKTKDSVKTASTDVSCPSSNGSKVTYGSDVYKIQCFEDRYGGDMGNSYAATFADCLNICTSTKGCEVVSYVPSTSICYLKDSVQPSEENSAVWGAQLTSSAATTSATSKVKGASVTKTTSSTSIKSSTTKTSTIKTTSAKSTSSTSTKSTSTRTTSTASTSTKSTSTTSKSSATTASSTKTTAKTSSSTSATPPYQTTVVQKKMTTTQNKRGLAYNDPSLTYLFGGSDSQVTWQYDWSQDGCTSANPDFQCLPMLWSDAAAATSTWNATVRAAVKAGVTHVLGFNEPDYSAQANMPAKQAAKSWIQYMQPYASMVKLGGPAVTGQPSGLVWLQDFYGNLTAMNATAFPDFQPVHWYDEAWNIYWFKDFITEAYEQTKVPIWITEFQGFGTDAEQATFLQTVTPWLDATSWIGGYAYFGVFNEYLIDNPGSDNNTSEWPQLSTVGDTFDGFYSTTVPASMQ